MKIEKISDTQVKIIISNTDLYDRNISLNELAQGSDKTHQFFHEIMEQASIECDFKIDGSPLMIEASPLSVDSIVMVVTKISAESLGFEEKLGILAQLAQLVHIAEARGATQEASKKVKKQPAQTRLIFSFSTLDDTISIASKIENMFNGFSSLVKNNGRYYLIIQNKDKRQVAKFRRLDLFLGEFGQKHGATLLSEYYLREHGEVILENDAVRKLAIINN